VPSLIETLVQELERPRELPPRVVNYINGYYGIDYDAIGTFLTGDLAKLEDDEIDLTLSPLFTPKLAEQSLVAELLGSDSVPPDQWPVLIQELARRPTRAQLVTPDGQSHDVILREVTIERFVHRLRLEGRISESVARQLDRVPAPDRPMLKAIARRAVWEKDGPQSILLRYLSNAIDRGSYSLEDAIELLNLVEGRKPADVPDLQARMSGWQEALRQQIEGTPGARPFFHSDIQLMHGGSRDQRQLDDQRASAKERELAFLKRLQQILSD
jgi:hypothetical protein